jgi:hypothetical protein
MPAAPHGGRSCDPGYSVELVFEAAAGLPFRRPASFYRRWLLQNPRCDGGCDIYTPKRIREQGLLRQQNLDAGLAGDNYLRSHSEKKTVLYHPHDAVQFLF